MKNVLSAVFNVVCDRPDLRAREEVYCCVVGTSKDALKPEQIGHALGISWNSSVLWVALNLWCDVPYGGADGTRTHDLCVANRTTGKTLSICLFESCSHQEKSMVFPFFPIPYHRVYVASCFFGHVLATWKFQKQR